MPERLPSHSHQASGSGSGWSGRRRVTGLLVALAGAGAAVVTLMLAGVRIHRQLVESSWQLLPLEPLRSDPFGSVWNLHTQPPLHNLVVGGVYRWSPFPAEGTLFVLYLVTLAAAVAILADILGHLGLGPVGAGLVAAVAVCGPNLLSTISIVSYEVPVVALLLGSIWWFQRHLRVPGAVSLLGLAVTLTALTMTRTLFHPVFVLALVVLAAVARRVPLRVFAAAAAIPVLVVGGWMGKNAVLFGTSTTSSWLGFNLQRGIAAPMARDVVERDVASGRVSSLALEYPWGTLEQYEAWTGDCRPERRHRVLTMRMKHPAVANFNHQCFIGLYEQAQEANLTLIRRHPVRYVRDRGQVIRSSWAITPIGQGGRIFGTALDAPERTWIDSVADVALMPVKVEVDDRDWNLPLLGVGVVTYRLSVTLLVLSGLLVARGLLSVVRLWRAGWRDRERAWTEADLVWLVAFAAFTVAVPVSGLLEYGENGRFRTLVDPLIVGLPLAVAVLRGRELWDRRRPAVDQPVTR